MHSIENVTSLLMSLFTIVVSWITIVDDIVRTVLNVWSLCSSCCR